MDGGQAGIQRPRGYLTEEFLINLFISEEAQRDSSHFGAGRLADEEEQALAIKLSSIVVPLESDTDFTALKPLQNTPE